MNMRINFRLSVFLLFVFLFSVNGGAGAQEQPNFIYPNFIPIPPSPVTFCGEQVPLEMQEVKERFEREILISALDRAQALLWLKR